MRRPRLVYLVTHPASARLLMVGQLAYLRELGYDVTLISSPGPDLDVVREREGVHTVAVPLARGMAPASDARSLPAVAAALRALRPDVVDARTPKAGVVGTLAAWLLRVPVRLYVLQGLRLETEAGATRAVLAAAERLAAACAHEVIAVSPSLRDAFVRARLAPAAKVRVLGGGSTNGVDVERFAPTAALRDEARALRRRLDIPDRAPVVGFIGRLARDKRIGDLLDAHLALQRRDPASRLVLVSIDLDDEETPAELAARIRATAGVVLVPRVDDVRPYLAAMDVLGFPSAREGFPNAVLEAAALELPAVGYPVTGVRDAIVDGVTGALVADGDVAGFTAALARYLDDRALAARHGAAGRARAVAEFARPRVWARWDQLYRAHLGARGLPLPQGEAA